MIIMKRYKLVKCPYCRNTFITEAGKRVKCRYCRHSFKIKDNIITADNSLDKIRYILYKVTSG